MGKYHNADKREQMVAKGLICSSGRIPVGTVESEDSEQIGPMGYVLQSGQLAQYAQSGMSHAEAREAAKQSNRTNPTDDIAWCNQCGSVKWDRSDKWDSSHLSGSALATASTCSHEMRQGVHLDRLAPSSSSPALMSSGRWNVRNRSDQVHSPLSHGMLRVGQMGVFDWHARFVTGRAARAEMTEISLREKVSPVRPILYRNEQNVLVPLDGHLSGDRTATPRMGKLGNERILLHNGRKAETEQERADRLANARLASVAARAAKAQKARKAANAESAAVKSGKRRKSVDSDIMADLAQMVLNTAK